MNLRLLANAVTQVTNPNISATWIPAAGSYTTAADGTRTPVTSTSTAQVQVQPISARDLMHMEALNIQGVMRSVHIYGNAQGVVRVDQKGGDQFQFPEIPGGVTRTWKVISVMETWPDWSRVIVVLQNA